MSELSVAVSTPLWATNIAHVADFVPQNPTVVTSTFGGYWSAKFDIQGSEDEINDWLQAGLGRHVEIFDRDTGCVWEGFVDRISGNIGNLSISMGPLMSIGNKVRLTYSTIYVDENTGETILGERRTTSWAEDAASQVRWGIITKSLSSAGTTPENADIIRDSFIAENAWPKSMSRNWSSDTPGQSSITIQCLGYVHWLAYPYESTTTGTQPLSTKLTSILAGTPNSAWLTFGTFHVDTNTTIDVPAYEQKSRIGLNLIKDMVARGDSSYNRWMFGIYDNREAWYHPAPTTINYYQQLADRKVRIDEVGVGEARRWNVRPGYWIMFPDFLIGQTEAGNLLQDHRAMFIEGATYQAPDDLNLDGGEVDRMSQLLSQLGLAGVGA